MNILWAASFKPPVGRPKTAVETFDRACPNEVPASLRTAFLLWSLSFGRALLGCGVTGECAFKGCCVFRSPCRDPLRGPCDASPSGLQQAYVTACLGTGGHLSGGNYRGLLPSAELRKLPRTKSPRRLMPDKWDDAMATRESAFPQHAVAVWPGTLPESATRTRTASGGFGQPAVGQSAPQRARPRTK